MDYVHFIPAKNFGQSTTKLNQGKSVDMQSAIAKGSCMTSFNLRVTSLFYLRERIMIVYHNRPLTFMKNAPFCNKSPQ